jgi:hypothetical protein
MEGPKVVLVGCEAGDWEGIYVDGTLAREGHKLEVWDVLEALGLSDKVESKDCTDENMEDMGWSLPAKLKDLKADE